MTPCCVTFSHDCEIYTMYSRDYNYQGWREACVFCGLEKERKRLKMSDYGPRLYFDEENASYSLHSSHRESSYGLHSLRTEMGMENVAIVYTVRTGKVAMVYTVRTQRR